MVGSFSPVIKQTYLQSLNLARKKSSYNSHGSVCLINSTISFASLLYASLSNFSSFFWFFFKPASSFSINPITFKNPGWWCWSSFCCWSFSSCAWFREPILCDVLFPFRLPFPLTFFPFVFFSFAFLSKYVSTDTVCFHGNVSCSSSSFFASTWFRFFRLFRSRFLLFGCDGGSLSTISALFPEIESLSAWAESRNHGS